MKKYFYTVLLCIMIIFLTSCSEGAELMDFIDPNEPHTLCDLDSSWTNLFNRAGTDYGWLCADGIYTVSLDGNDKISGADGETKTLFIFSDTIIGSANKNGKISNSCWANHSAAVLEGDTPDPEKMTFYYGLNGSMDTEENTNLFGQNQWLFDCFTLNNSVYILAFTQENWKPVQIDIIEIPISEDCEPLFSDFKRTENVTQLLKKTAAKEYAYGIGIMNNTTDAHAENADEYIYFYGYIDNIDAFHTKDLIVSRIHKDDIGDFSNLRYWNGTDWCENIEDSAILIENVSCELSVTYIPDGPFEGKYMAVYTQNVESEKIMYALSDSPIGPFEESVQIYTAEEYRKPLEHGDGTYYTYNAKAHPHLSKDGSILISYNVNVRDGNAVKTEDYHPRFIKLEW